MAAVHVTAVIRPGPRLSESFREVRGLETALLSGSEADGGGCFVFRRFGGVPAGSQASYLDSLVEQGRCQNRFGAGIAGNTPQLAAYRPDDED